MNAGNTIMKKLARPLLASLAALTLGYALTASAGEAEIRKNLAARIPQFAKIDEITKSPVPGLYEVRINGFEIFYTDEQGNYLLQGNLIDVKARRNLTEERIEKLSEVAFDKLPFKDAIVFKQGSGARRLVVFEDPNCHFCKDVEKNLVALKDVTIYTFLIPILGPDSVQKSRDIWCAKDAAKTWRSWMLSGVAPQREMGHCDTSALTRNTALAEKHRVMGTPAIVFDDGSRIGGFVELDKLEKRLDEVAAATSKKEKG